MIGMPSSARTRVTSSIISSKRCASPSSASWRRIVVITPPAIWWRRNAASKSLGPPVGRPSALASLPEVRSDEPEQPVVDVDGVAELAQVRHQALRIGQRRAPRERPAAGLQRGHAVLGGRQVGQRGEPDRGVRVQLQRRVTERRPQRRQQRRGALGREEPAGVLDVDAVDVGGRGEQRGEPGVERVVVNGADRERERRDDLGPACLADLAADASAASMSCIGSRTTKRSMPFATSRVVDQLHELRVREFPGDEAEPGADELQRRGRHRGAGEPDPLPRVLAVGAHRDAHGGAGGEVQRAEPDPVDQRGDLQHVAGAKPGRAPQALVAVAAARRRRVGSISARAGLRLASRSGRAPGGEVGIRGDRGVQARWWRRRRSWCGRARRGARRRASARSAPCTISLASSES